MAALGSGTMATGLPHPNFAAAAAILRRTPLRLVCSVPAPTPRKLTNRKNYLRQKVLKTLTKPYPSSFTVESPQKNPAIPVELKQEQVLIEQFSGDFCPATVLNELEEREMQEFREAEVREPVKLVDDRIGNVSKNSIFKHGLWLVAAFLFQTICAVWVFGSAEFEDKNSALEVDVNGKGKSNVKYLRNTELRLENGGFVYVDEDEIEKKIEEIQVMAREARARERLEREVNGFPAGDSEGEDEFGQSGIEKEVNDRLAKVRRRYKYTRGTVPVGSVDRVKENAVSEKNNLAGRQPMDDVKKDGVSEKKSLGGKEVEESLMFKKKYRFRGLSSKPSDKPKGFTGLVDHGVGKEAITSEGGGGEVLMNGGIGGDVADLLVDVRKQDLWPSDFRAGMSIRLEDGEKKQVLEAPMLQGTAEKKLVKEKDRREAEEKVGFVKSKSDGLAQERNQGKPLTNAEISRKSNILEKTDLSNEHDVLNNTGNLKSRGTENYQSASKIGQDNLESVTDCWWLRLPYVLVILMQRRLDGNGVEQGLYTLSSPYAENDSSHMVAFEDRSDATNFCYLVQSFFEDLEDFTAEIVPLSIKELKERVSSDTLKVIVVKKGQLKLYAGQPLPDVEMALRSLVGQN
ncbi:uncharacterized protein [Coffea arabica]|uniref:Uncharacterized protein n=1 Tax=Coffea arabica TaxID=13443 RepID=A0A6P6WRW6_COFAR|nr:uncharacterized protein LOC113735330 [Coffea arabica]XP_027120826.1 uncharacterized protein LOC113737882 [Coffea arabica]